MRLRRAWYDVFTRAYPEYSDSIWGRIALAVVANLLCTLVILLLGGARKANAQPKNADDGTSDERERNHRVMLSLSLGMLQGWLWNNVVDQIFTWEQETTLSALGSDDVQALNTQDKIVYEAIDLLAVVIITVFLLGLRIAMALSVKQAKARAVLYLFSGN